MNGAWLFPDLRYAIRRLRNDSSTTVVIVLILGLGMGANAALFGVVNGLLRPLPVTAPDRLVVVAAETPGDDTGLQFQYSYPALQDVERQATVFQDVFATALQIRGFSTGGKTTRFFSSAVTGNYFSALGVKPAAGRLFRPGEGENTRDRLNIGNILLARTAARQTQMGIRVALGATPAHLIRDAVTKSLLLVGLGAIAGLLVGRLAIRGFAASLNLGTDVPVSLDFHFDQRVFLYALLSTLFAATIMVLWRALRIARTAPSATLRDGARGSTGARSKRT